VPEGATVDRGDELVDVSPVSLRVRFALVEHS
jgi:hypothetical protein